MVVCLCQGVSDREIRQAIARGAVTRKQVTRACGAGAGCGGCHESIQQLLSDAGCELRAERAPGARAPKPTTFRAAISAA